MDMFLNCIDMVFNSFYSLFLTPIPYLNISILNLVLDVLIIVVFGKILVWAIKKGM